MHLLETAYSPVTGIFDRLGITGKDLRNDSNLASARLLNLYRRRETYDTYNAKDQIFTTNLTYGVSSYPLRGR
jgi:hypothetical protein